MQDLTASIVLLNPKAAAARLGVTDGTLAKWRLSGFGPTFIKVGSRVKYTPNAIDSWLVSRERVSTSDRDWAA